MFLFSETKSLTSSFFTTHLTLCHSVHYLHECARSLKSTVICIGRGIICLVGLNVRTPVVWVFVKLPMQRILKQKPWQMDLLTSWSGRLSKPTWPARDRERTPLSCRIEITVVKIIKILNAGGGYFLTRYGWQNTLLTWKWKHVDKVHGTVYGCIVMVSKPSSKGAFNVGGGCWNPHEWRGSGVVTGRK